MNKKHAKTIASSSRPTQRSETTLPQQTVEQSLPIPMPESLHETNFALSGDVCWAAQSYDSNVFYQQQNMMVPAEALPFPTLQAEHVDSHSTQPHAPQPITTWNPTIAAEADYALDDSPFLPVEPRQGVAPSLPLLAEEDIFPDVGSTDNWTNDSGVGRFSTPLSFFPSSTFAEFTNEPYNALPSRETTPVRSTTSTPPRRERIIFRDTKDFEDGFYEIEFSPYKDDLPRDYFKKYDRKAMNEYFSSTDLYASPPKPKWL